MAANKRAYRAALNKSVFESSESPQKGSSATTAGDSLFKSLLCQDDDKSAQLKFMINKAETVHPKPPKGSSQPYTVSGAIF